jgi:Mn2+/Fe2+ NRAMP family transporter
MVGGNGYQILLSTFIPHIELSSNFALMFVALIGTSISPYLFFWQTSQEVEEEVSKGKLKDIGKGNPKTTNKEIKSMRIDTLTGIGFSHFIVWSIIITTAGSLHAHGITDIHSAEQAAESLKPLVTSFPNAGEISKTIFALGIIGTGLLSIPVLAGSGAYALSDVFGWKEGLNKKFGQAKSFYLVMIICGLIGLSIPILGVNPIQALVYSAVINGVVTIPILFVLMKIANDKSILKEKTNGHLSNIIGWATFGIMIFSAIVMFATWGK